MNKINKVVINSIAVIVALVGVLNIIDYIYASSAVNAATSNLTMSATINHSATVTISASSVALDITPGAGTAGGTDGALGKSSAVTITTYTNTASTCNVTMNAATTTLNYKVNDDTTYTIASLADSVTSDSAFVNDHWGYQVDSGNWQKVALKDNAIKSYTTDTGSTGATSSVVFGARLSQATKPGTYTNSVTFAATCPTT